MVCTDIAISFVLVTQNKKVLLVLLRISIPPQHVGADLGLDEGLAPRPSAQVNAGQKRLQVVVTGSAGDLFC